MASFLKNDVILVRYPFTDLTISKARPAVVIHAPHPSQDALIVPLTSRTGGLLAGEFVLSDFAKAGLNVPSAVKRGLFTIQSTLVHKKLGELAPADANQLEQSLRTWLGLV